MDQLILHDTQTVCGWPSSARSEFSAVARRDIAVARRNLASMTRYVDLHDAHLAACDGGLDDRIPLMTVETFPRATGGIQSVLDGRGQPTEVVPTTEDGDAVTPTGSLDFFRTGQKVRTVCLPARSTLILTICLCPLRACTVRLRLYILCHFILPYQSLLIPLNRVSHSVYKCFVRHET